jgi:MazG family protein
MSSIHALLETMRKLRDKDNGCPWDIEQTFESLSQCVVEEAYEVSDAISRKDFENLKEELGDILLQVVFHAEIAKELKLFSFDEIVESLNQKLIRRHPHVFDGAPRPNSSSEQTQSWEAMKDLEKDKKELKNLFDDIPASMPPMLRAKKIQKKANKKGFDWKANIDVINKIEEELEELKQAIKENNQRNTQEELGDLLFSIVNLSRHLEIDSSDALTKANLKFMERFLLMEKEISQNKKKMEDLPVEDLEKIWVKIKSYE